MLVRRIGAGRIVTIGMMAPDAVDAHPTLGRYLRRLLRNDFPTTRVDDLGLAVIGYGPFGGMGFLHGKAADRSTASSSWPRPPRPDRRARPPSRSSPGIHDLADLACRRRRRRHRRHRHPTVRHADLARGHPRRQARRGREADVHHHRPSGRLIDLADERDGC